jgi:hypothetical protein
MCESTREKTNPFLSKKDALKSLQQNESCSVVDRYESVSGCGGAADATGS